MIDTIWMSSRCLSSVQVVLQIQRVAYIKIYEFGRKYLVKLLIVVLTDGPIFFYLQESFARAKNWVKELQRQASPNIVIALSGNKADLANKRAVDFQVKTKNFVLTVFLYAFLRNTHLLLLINMIVMLCFETYSLKTTNNCLVFPVNVWEWICEEAQKTNCYYIVLTGCPVLRRWQQLAFYGDVS